MAVRKASKSLPESELALRTIAMPVFANAHGDIFGGWLLSQMDLAGSAVAVRRANGGFVTVAVTAMSFQRPVFVGDKMDCYAKILKVGRTSITVKVEAFARRGRSGKQIQVTEGVFTYVAVNSKSKPAAGVKCSRLPLRMATSLLAYVGDIRPQLFGDGERGATRGSLRQDGLLGSLFLAHSKLFERARRTSAFGGKADTHGLIFTYILCYIQRRELVEK